MSKSSKKNRRQHPPAQPVPQQAPELQNAGIGSGSAQGGAQAPEARNRQGMVSGQQQFRGQSSRLADQVPQEPPPERRGATQEQRDWNAPPRNVPGGTREREQQQRQPYQGVDRRHGERRQGSGNCAQQTLQHPQSQEHEEHDE